MRIHELLPNRSLRSGFLEAVSSFSDLAVLEFGPEGTTHYWASTVPRITPLAYTSGILETDVIFGKTTRYEAAVRELIQKPLGGLILLSSCVSDIINADLCSIAAKIQKESSVPLVAVDKLRLDWDYTRGFQLAYDTIAKNLSRLCPAADPIPGSVAILGLHPTDYRGLSDFTEVKRMTEEILGLTCLNKPDGTLPLSSLSKASCLLVLRREALPLAEAVSRQSGTPFRFAQPYGPAASRELLSAAAEMTGASCEDGPVFEQDWEDALEAAELLRSRLRQTGCRHAMVHADADRAEALGKFFRQECGLPQVTLPNTTEEKRRDGLLPLSSQEELLSLVRRDPPSFLLTDEVFCQALQGACPLMLFSAPLLTRKDLCRHAPFMGLRGTAFLAEAILNLPLG